MQTVLPQNLNYNNIKPVGFPSHVRFEKFTPVAFNTSSTGASSSDIIRFNISSNGFWDPYSAYIKIEVDVSGMDGVKDLTTGSACGSQQLDNSASSYIQQMILYKGGTEIERIEEYDTIAAILNDVHGSADNKQVRSYEGMNSNQSSFGPQYNNQIFQTPQNNGAIVGTDFCNAGYMPFINPGPNNQRTGANFTAVSHALIAQNTSGQVLNRYEFILNQDDSKNSCQFSTPTQQVNQTQTVAGRNVLSTGLVFGNNIYGYKQPFCPQLSSFGNEAILSKNIYAFTTYKGLVGQHILSDKQTFVIPLISGLLGVLMPKESYKYIPMKALQDLIIEFRLSPYAMFTSGYADGTTTAYQTGNANNPMNTGTNPMLTRSWRISKFEINVEMQYFEPTVENVILSKLNTQTGIVIHTQSWMLGPRYSIGSNQGPNGTYQINLAFESLKNVLFCFMPDDYLTYSYCRKQYRISANITSMQLKIGSEYYPPLPVTGHAGCSAGYQSILNESDFNNAEFLVQLYKTFGKFNDIQTNSTINSSNFAVNTRAYNPANTLALNTGTVLSNVDTTLSAPFFHENRCVGRSVYGINVETLNQDFSVISGLNTIKNSPYEINLKSDSVNAFNRPYTMYVFNNYDMLVQLRDTGIQILGRG